MAANDVFSIIPFGINNDENDIPKGRSWTGIVSLTAGQPIALDLKPLANLQRAFDFKSIFIDNSAGTSGVSVSMKAMGTVIIPPAYQAIIPIFMSADNVLTFAGAGTVNFTLVDRDVHLGVWNTAGGGGSANLGNNVDAVAPVTSGLVGNDVYLYTYDPVNNQFNRAPANYQTIQNGNNIPLADSKNAPLICAYIFATDADNSGGNGVPIAGVVPADNLNLGYPGLRVISAPQLWNGASADRQRGNVDTGTLITLAAQAAGTVNSADQTNYNGRGVKLGINLSALGAATTVTTTIQGKDAASGVYYNIISTTAVAAAGFATLEVYPGIAAVANAAANDVLPRTWRVQQGVAGTNTATGTVGASVIL
jgi:hypothetical protein